MIFVIVLFVVLVFLGRDDLQLVGIAVSLVALFGALGLCVWLDINPGYFMAYVAMLDIVLVLKLYGGDLPW